MRELVGRGWGEWCLVMVWMYVEMNVEKIKRDRSLSALSALLSAYCE